ncbi:hypothetical protein JCM19992_20220 [Thermostilla marina]
MRRPFVSRRRFLQGTAATTAALFWNVSRSAGAETPKVHLATNVYPWYTFYRRENRDFEADLDASLKEVAASGMDGFEPILNTPDDVARLAPVLNKHKLEMRSFYVNSVLHDPKAAEESISRITTIARAAKETLGTQIVVTNPSPKSWNREAPDNAKNDRELETQAAALEQLGTELSKLGVVLAYHNHDMELRNAAREFHHMMLATTPQHVTLCLDAHWMYRGSGNSQVALFDIVELYGERVSEVHLRQSQDGTWTEAFGPGDIDYPRLIRLLASKGITRPHWVLEQAVEGGSPNTMNAVQAHRAGREAFFAMLSG